MAIYDRLPQSLKSDYREDTGQLYNPVVSEEGLRLSHPQTQVYFPGEGTFEFPEFEIDNVRLEAVPGDYILGFTLTESSSSEEEESLPTQQMLYGVFLDPNFPTNNLLVDDEEKVYSPGYPEGFLRVRTEGLASVRVQTDTSFFVDSVEISPQEGWAEIETSSEEVSLNNVGTIKNLFVRVRKTVIKKEPQLFLQPVGRDTLDGIPDYRENICLLNFSKSGRVSVLRSFTKTPVNLEITKLLTGFWDKELDKAYETLFFYIVDYLNPFTAKSSFLSFLAQQWGWQGKYYSAVGGTEAQRRNLMSISWGTNLLSRSSRPEIGNMKIVFSGKGFTNWADWQGRFFEDFSGNEFYFYGSLAQLSPTGFPWRLAPYIVQGSYVYFDEPPLLSPPMDLEYVEGAGWRFKAEEPGMVGISRLAGGSETVEYEIIPWEPEERGEPGVWYGTWGSKGTLATLRALVDTVDLHGVTPENSVRMNPKVFTFPLPEGVDFINIRVDGEPTGSKKLKGIENRTTSSTRARLSFDPGSRLTPEFHTVEIETTGATIDVTEEILREITYTVYPSKKDSSSLLEPWFTLAPLADYAKADENQGTESKHGFLRLPVDYPRNGKEWLSAESICDLFVLFGKENDVLSVVEKKREPVPLYEVEFRKASSRRFFQEDYLVSSFENIDVPQEEGWEPASGRVGSEEEPGWKEPKTVPYNAEEQRRSLFGLWLGGWWTRVGNLPLSGFLSKDIEEGKLIKLPKTWKDYPESSYPRLRDTWEEKTNFFRPCYAYAAADLVAADEPVFDVEV
jgi:hypothetical protein